MKAKINGIEVEGTPQEIMDYERLTKPSKSPTHKISPQEFVPFDPNWSEKPGFIIKTVDKANTTATGSFIGGSWLGYGELMPYNPKKLCKGPCYCTGACQK